MRRFFPDGNTAVSGHYETFIVCHSFAFATADDLLDLGMRLAPLMNRARGAGRLRVNLTDSRCPDGSNALRQTASVSFHTRLDSPAVAVPYRQAGGET